MRSHAFVLAALCILPVLPLPAASAAPRAPEPVEALGPDAEGGWRLAYLVHRDEAGPVALALDVRREDGAGAVAASARDLGVRALPAGATRVEAPFLPAEGPGTYSVSLVADGTRGPPLVFAPEGGGASARFAFSIEDEPTTLALTNESVNADGKAKAPGEAVVTRAVLRDGNGVGDVDGLRWRLDSPDGTHAEDALPLEAPPEATSAPVEHRLARSPLAAGLHRVTLLAVKDGASVAAATRTFSVRDVPPVLAPATLPVATAGRAGALETQVHLADRNGAPNPLEARVYRGSVRAEAQGFAATLGEPARLPDDEGHGRALVPLRVDVPANATAGAYRVSLYAGGVLVGAVPFEVRAPPAPIDLRVVARHANPRLPATWTVEAPGWDVSQARVTFQATRWDGAPAPGIVARLEGDALRVTGPVDLVPGRYDARLRLELPNGSAGEAAWSFEAGPTLGVRLEAPQVGGREARIVVRNDGGVPVKRLVAEVAPDVARATLLVDGQPLEAKSAGGARRVFSGFTLAPGAAAELVVRLPDGPMPSGPREAEVRVLALPGGA